MIRKMFDSAMIPETKKILLSETNILLKSLLMEMKNLIQIFIGKYSESIIELENLFKQNVEKANVS